MTSEKACRHEKNCDAAGERRIESQFPVPALIRGRASAAHVGRARSSIILGCGYYGRAALAAKTSKKTPRF